MPVRVLITEGTRADCSQTEYLIEGIDAEYLLADKGCDSDKIMEKAKEGGMTPVIPPRCSRINSRDYDKYLYKLRHLVENAFLKMKHCVALLRATLKERTPFFQPCRFAVSRFGLESIDDTI